MAAGQREKKVDFVLHPAWKYILSTDNLKMRPSQECIIIKMLLSRDNENTVMPI